MSDPRFSLRRMLFPAKPAQWLGAIGVAGAIAAALVFAAVVIGLPNLAAATPHPLGWAKLLHFTFERSTAYRAASVTPPPELNSKALIEKAATHYDRVCANCHGAPELGQNPIALSMRPQPQYLMTSLDQFTPSELFVILKGGVKYSAMPAWPAGDRDDEIWAMVSFLRAMSKMDYAQYRAVTQGPALAATGRPPALPPGPFRSQPYVIGGTQTAELEVNFAVPALGFGHTANMEDVARSCVACHGSDGRARASGGIPNIALLSREQIAEQLEHYRIGTRQSGIMQNVAVQLTPQQIDSLAAYYAAKPKRQSLVIRATPAVLVTGERIAIRGIPDRRVAACASCHDVTRAAAKAYPGLDGQYPRYLRDQLRLYRSGVRGGDMPGNPMPAAVAGMSDAEINAVALYYAARSPSAPPDRAAPFQPQRESPVRRPSL
ncbi:c-type cytochrome [Sphingomonas japonica]|uniref:Cytochrome c553 n=1 Tax=Sphingomonas japonica TaxID=511662 RepID=A0ABX0TX94_9SPHN|nr:c-type cytochrome [Sphingomonas japonica]NIJ22843.1 cytochrome c553 [Sphingomonas japonica]